MTGNELNEGIAIPLDTEPVQTAGEQDASTGEAEFGWKLKAFVVPVPGATPPKWRVSLSFVAQGNRSREFVSDSVEVGLDNEAMVTFSIPPVPSEDDYGVHRFETAFRSSARGRRAAEPGTDIPQVQLWFKLVSNGTLPVSLLIEETDITIFWIIGARNISLTTTGE